MLFDLQGRGRRNAVRVIYLFLAVLMGGGLLLFGVGTGTGGGILDVFKNNGSSTQSQFSAAEKRANREVRANPKDAQAWATLARVRFQRADFDETKNAFTDAGRQTLAQSTQAWQKYLDLHPKHPDATLARLMATAYSGEGLNQPDQAASALEIVTQEQPTASSFAQLAQYAWLANENRKGDLAAARAVDLAPKSQQALLQRQLKSARKQIQKQALNNAVQQGASGAPSG